MGPLFFLTLDQTISLAKIRDEMLDRIIRSLLKLFYSKGVCLSDSSECHIKRGSCLLSLKICRFQNHRKTIFCLVS